MIYTTLWSAILCLYVSCTLCRKGRSMAVGENLVLDGRWYRMEVKCVEVKEPKDGGKYFNGKVQSNGEVDLVSVNGSLENFVATEMTVTDEEDEISNEMQKWAGDVIEYGLDE